MSPPARRLLAVLPLLVASAPVASAQAQLAWEQVVSSGEYDDTARTVAFGATSGQAVIAGQLRTFGSSNRAAWLHSRTASGVPLGNHQWPVSPHGSYAWLDADVGPGGDIAVVGGQPGGAMVAMCTAFADFVWGPHTLPAPFVVAGAVVFDANGDVLVAGQTSTADVFVARYSPGGELVDSTIWAHPVGGSDHATGLALDAAGNVHVVGVAAFGGPTRAFVLKLTPALDFVWYAETLGNQSLPPGPALALDASGNAYVACGVKLTGGVQQQVFSLWKVLPDGTTDWLAQTSDAAHSSGRAKSVAIDAQGNVAVAGSWSGDNQVEGVLRSYDPAGSLRWSHFAGGLESYYDSVAVDAGGDVLVAGWTGSPPHVLSSRHDRDGNLRWSHVDPDWEGQGTKTVGIGVAPSGGAIVGCGVTTFAAPRFLRWYRLDAAVFPVCEGDGALAACPCGNASDPAERAGCVHSQGSGGRLEGVGLASLAGDTLTLVGTTMPDTFVLYFQGDAAVAPAPFGDGLRCAGGNLLRLGLRANQGGGSSFPAAGDPVLSVEGAVGAPGTRWYQAWFRDPTPHCTSRTFNATNAVRVNWHP